MYYHYLLNSSSHLRKWGGYKTKVMGINDMMQSIPRSVGKVNTPLTF